MRIKLNVFFILFLFASYFAGWLQQSLILFASVLLHELGHVLAAKKLKIAVYEVELMPYGGVARMEELSKLGGTAEAVVSAAGPATSFLIALACFFFGGFSELIASGCNYNLIICAFNLLPVIPIDGGKIARNVLAFFMGYMQATRLLVFAGRAVAFVLSGLNIYMLVSGGRSAALIIAAAFIYLGTLKEEKLSYYYFLFIGNSTKSKLTAMGRIRKRFIKVSEGARIRQIVNRFSPVTLCYVQVLDAKGAIIGTLSENEIVEGFLKYGYDGKVGQIINN